jgi:hypothetical protein
MLAVIDGQPGDELMMNRFRSLLGQLDARYIETSQQIGDMTVKAQQMLRDQGVAVRLLDVMEGMNRIPSLGVSNQRYAEYVAMYVVLRQEGQSHEEGIGALSELTNALGR